jgi:hypothetical protein
MREFSQLASVPKVAEGSVDTPDGGNQTDRETERQRRSGAVDVLNRLGGERRVLMSKLGVLKGVAALATVPASLTLTRRGRGASGS